jgi:hypothetical protein
MCERATTCCVGALGGVEPAARSARQRQVRSRQLPDASGLAYLEFCGAVLSQPVLALTITALRVPTPEGRLRQFTPRPVPAKRVGGLSVRDEARPRQAADRILNGPVTAVGPSGLSFGPVSSTEEPIQGANVFISHAFQDKASTDLLEVALKRQGFNVWSDRDLAPGQSIIRAIGNAVEAADVIIFLITPASAHSAILDAEMSAAVAHKIRAPSKVLLPVLKDVGPSELPPLLANWQAVSFEDLLRAETGQTLLKAAVSASRSSSTSPHEYWELERESTDLAQEESEQLR